MQTFLPYASWEESARSLDRQRLGKQRVECLQILRSLSPNVETKGWANHPAVKMWKGHELALLNYGLYVCNEWTDRGYKDTCADKMKAMIGDFSALSLEAPEWWGDPRIHESHRRKLLWKLPEWYSQQFPDLEIPEDEPEYVWPV